MKKLTALCIIFCFITACSSLPSKPPMVDGSKRVPVNTQPIDTNFTNAL